jgi:hypothetical protein
LIVLGGTKQAFYLDPYGSLPAVFSAVERTVAATPTLIGSDADWDEQLMAELGFPEKIEWLPSGLTLKKNVRRLTANHCLNLSDWTTSRHWPTPQTDFSVNNDTDAAVKKITAKIKDTISAVSMHHPLYFSLTAGMDSRMLLACARDHLDISSFFTFVGGTKSVDVDIPTVLARRFKLDHKFIYTEKASPGELDDWLALTGRSSSGAIWKIHKSLKQLEPNRVLLPGTAGEIVRRTMQWRPADKPGTKISAAEVLTRCKLPQHPALLQATEEWVAGLQFVDTFTFLALTFVEQRLSCWAAPQHYGNTTSAFEFTPFNSRTIFKTAMRLPHEYRRTKQLPVDFIRHAWPELLNYPFNQFTGVKGRFYSNVDWVKKFLKDLMHR